MKKGFYIFVIIAAIVLLAIYYFTQTHSGLSQRIMWKYPVPIERRESAKQELARHTVEELKLLLINGPG